MELKNLIFHHLIKEGNEIPVINFQNEVLNVKNETVVDFFEKTTESFRSKNPTYGNFEEYDRKNNPVDSFEKLLEQYSETKLFLEFTKKSTNLLKEKIANLPNAKGGFLFFIHYGYKHEEFIITALIDKKTQFVIKKDETISALKALDIDNLAIASRINVSKWKNHAQEKKESQYLAFIKGKRDISKYFKSFIGCTDARASSTNLRNLKSALNGYVKKYEFLPNEKEKVLREIESYCEKQYFSKEDIEKESISEIIKINTSVKEETFSDYVMSNDLAVSGSFIVTRKSDLRIIQLTKINGKGYSLSFNNDLINTTIVKQNQDILIKGGANNLDEETLNMFEQDKN